MSQLSSNSPSDVFRWLGSDRRGVPYHLHPLNLVWSDVGADNDLNVYRAVADRLQADRSCWSVLLRESNWRYPLVGCVCLLLTCEEGHFDDLAYRFRAGSMVTPQIAVTMGLVYPRQSLAFLTAFLDEPESVHNPRAFVSAEQVLIRLGCAAETLPARPGRWSSSFAEDDVPLAESVVEQHWVFWRRRGVRLSSGEPST